MRRLRCLRCSSQIMKSAFHDPHLCRKCEREMKPKERFAYLDQ